MVLRPDELNVQWPACLGGTYPFLGRCGRDL